MSRDRGCRAGPKAIEQADRSVGWLTMNPFGKPSEVNDVVRTLTASSTGITLGYRLAGCRLNAGKVLVGDTSEV